MSSVKSKKLIIPIIILIITVSVIATHAGQKAALKILQLFILSVILTYLVGPTSELFQKTGLKKHHSIILVYIVFIVFLVLFLFLLLPQLAESAIMFARVMPDILNQYNTLLQKFNNIMTQFRLPEAVEHSINKEILRIADTLESRLSKLAGAAVDSVPAIISFILDLSLASVLSYYILKNPEYISLFILRLFPQKMRILAKRTGRELGDVLSGFIQGQLMASFLVGLIETVFLYIIGIKHALVLGFFGGITNLIPYFGPFIGAIPSVAEALISSPYKALIVIAGFIVIQQVDGSFITPFLVEKKLGLNPIATLTIIILGGEMFGLPGMLFSLPAAAMLRILIYRVSDVIIENKASKVNSKNI